MTHVTCRLTAKNRDQLRNLRSVIEYGYLYLFLLLLLQTCVWPMMSLPLTVSCFRKIQTGFAFLVPAHPSGPGQTAVKWVCVCVCVSMCPTYRHRQTDYAPSVAVSRIWHHCLVLQCTKAQPRPKSWRGPYVGRISAQPLPFPPLPSQYCSTPVSSIPLHLLFSSSP